MKIVFFLISIFFIMIGFREVYANNNIEINVDMSVKVSVVPDLYNVGYDGWGDIINPKAVSFLNDVGIKYCRIVMELDELCGNKYGEYNWQYVTAKDRDLGFIDRIKQIKSNGWEPVIVFSYHGGENRIPKWFHGENNDNNEKSWTRYNVDGSLEVNGIGNQLKIASDIAKDIVEKISSEGFEGLHWETIYEMGTEMPIVDIHYNIAKGIRESDLNAKIIGPATWPGWSVEEKFVKPFFEKYDADLLDYVSVHWYGTNEHELWDMGFDPNKDFIKMSDRKYLDYLMSMTNKYADWSINLRNLLDDPKLNHKKKKIGIMFTEFDAVAQSPYMRNPENPKWPNYSIESDCYVNTNFFGSIWCMSVLTNMAKNGKADAMFKFNTRNYYGIVDNAGDDDFLRLPIWFAWKLLQDKAKVIKGAEILKTGDKNAPETLEITAVKSEKKLNLIIINKSFKDENAGIHIYNGNFEKTTRYLFDEDRTASFIGRKSGTNEEGKFEQFPNDDKNLLCLEPMEIIKIEQNKNNISLDNVGFPAMSITVMSME